jgi:hypothetical protein
LISVLDVVAATGVPKKIQEPVVGPKYYEPGARKLAIDRAAVVWAEFI